MAAINYINATEFLETLKAQGLLIVSVYEYEADRKSVV